MADVANWPSIQRSGLLCASRLIAAAGLGEVERNRLERSQRLTQVELPNGARLRDQRPLPPDALGGCLSGLIPADWYAAVNARVFFWVDPERLNRQRAACAPRPQVVLTVDALALLADYQDKAELTPINTGNARRKPARRGAASSVPVGRWLEDGWASEAQALGSAPRARSHRPVEFTVRDAVPDIARYIVRVDQLGPGACFADGA
jgi:hypothetical protein